MLGITLKTAPGLGDRLVFSSFPENYYLNTGKKVIDVNQNWIFDYNPYVIRDEEPTEIINLWEKSAEFNRCLKNITRPIWFSVADRTAAMFNHICFLKHPRLYHYEDEIKYRRVVLHTTGKTQNEGIPDFIIEHIKNKYMGYEIIQIGSTGDKDAFVVDGRGLGFWDSAEIISHAEIFIGVDSGPAWIAAAYPQVTVKKILTQYIPEQLCTSVIPGSVFNCHMHWYDFSCLYYNTSKHDAGITWSYLKI